MTQMERDQAAMDRALVAHGHREKAAALDRARARATLLEDMRIGTLLAIQDVEEGR